MVGTHHHHNAAGVVRQHHGYTHGLVAHLCHYQALAAGFGGGKAECAHAVGGATVNSIVQVNIGAFHGLAFVIYHLTGNFYLRAQCLAQQQQGKEIKKI